MLTITVTALLGIGVGYALYWPVQHLLDMRRRPCAGCGAILPLRRMIVANRKHRVVGALCFLCEGRAERTDEFYRQMLSQAERPSR